MGLRMRWAFEYRRLQFWVLNFVVVSSRECGAGAGMLRGLRSMRDTALPRALRRAPPYCNLVSRTDFTNSHIDSKDVISRRFDIHSTFHDLLQFYYKLLKYVIIAAKCFLSRISFLFHTRYRLDSVILVVIKRAFTRNFCCILYEIIYLLFIVNLLINTTNYENWQEVRTYSTKEISGK